MQLRIKATKIELTPEIKDYIQKKMDMLEKYLGDIKVVNCDVEVGLAVGDQRSGDIYRTEVNLSLPGEMIRVEKTEKELLKSIDKVKDHLRQVISRHKKKMLDRKRKG